LAINFRSPERLFVRGFFYFRNAVFSPRRAAARSNFRADLRVWRRRLYFFLARLRFTISPFVSLARVFSPSLLVSPIGSPHALGRRSTLAKFDATF